MPIAAEATSPAAETARAPAEAEPAVEPTFDSGAEAILQGDSVVPTEN